MNTNKVRVRFAPSPTGGLHLGGVRTALFNYLFAKKNNGTFVLRIEDTDQTRFVEGAEDYIFKCLEWCGISPDESVLNPGEFAPYRQSERKPLYRQYATQLVNQGNAYYAFDTPEDLEAMRTHLKTAENPSPQYNYKTRMSMKNSLTLSEEETQSLLNNNTPYVIRIKIPENDTITFTDIIRGEINHHSNEVDDKVLLKADGMPTYHLAVVVDDFLMKISHVFRGEEWLPSAPVHILLWKYLGWENSMPQWGHLPLILKPEGNGKLSKRDGERLGFPVFAMDWQDPNSGEVTIGFKERGFMPEAFVNLLAMLGWHPGTEQEIFSLEELCSQFSVDRIQKSGAKFDYEKAKWFNQQHIQKSDNETLAKLVTPFFEKENINVSSASFATVIGLIKDRCQLLNDFVPQGSFFFKAPVPIDTDSITSKWTTEKKDFFENWSIQLQNTEEWNHQTLHDSFEANAAASGIKKGELMLPLRIMLVGGKFGPHVFDIMEIIGREEVINRIKNGLAMINN